MAMKGVLVVTVVVVLWMLPECAGGWVNQHLLMTPDEVAAVAGSPEWVILDCRGKNEYEKEHIPGAIFFDCRRDLRDGTERVLGPSELEDILGKAGVSNGSYIVVYGDAKHLVHASVGFWILEYLGHDKVRFLDGGLTAWKAEGKPTTRTPVTLPPATFKANPIPSRIASTEELIRIATDDLKDVQVIDTRTSREFSGIEVRSLRGGRLPNTTMNLSHDLTFDKRTGKLFPEEIAAKFYGNLDPRKRTIVMCQSGSRCTLIYLQLRLMGFKEPANYDDGWTVYGNSIFPPLPIENEQWINFEGLVRMSEEIKKLQRELEELRKELNLPPRMETQ